MDPSVVRRAPRTAFVTFALSALAAGCASPRPAVDHVQVPAAVAESTIRFRKEYVLAPGDQVEVAVRRTPEASRTVTIRPDGLVTLPIAKDVPAAGLTPRELEQKITQVLAGRLVEPEVTVIPIQIRQPVVYVLGDVKNPTAIPFRDAPTALQAVALAGGFLHSASARNTVVIRLGEDGVLRALAADPGPNGQPGPYMGLRALPTRADDVVFVPENGRAQVARLLDDFINRPLSGVSAVLATYANFRFAQELNRQQ